MMANLHELDKSLFALMKELHTSSLDPKIKSTFVALIAVNRALIDEVIRLQIEKV